jgi:RNA polymerase sigma factor (TIGR02999 family)
MGKMGDDTALFTELYHQLKRRARQLRRGQGGTLDTTALVHEAWLKLHGAGCAPDDARHLFNIAAQAMRQVLIDHARGRAALKRGGALAAVELDADLVGESAEIPDALDMLALLDRLRGVDARKADVLEWHVLGGVGLVDVAQALDISEGTVKRDLRAARALLTLWASGAGAPETLAESA